MVILGLVLTGLAALLHCYIFWMESVTWTSPATRKVFGTSPQQAEQTRELAYNQGFYNLFLAIAVFLGIGFFWAGQAPIGATLIFTGAGSMVAAGVVLLSSPGRVSAALKQLVLPLVGILCLAIGLWIG